MLSLSIFLNLSYTVCAYFFLSSDFIKETSTKCVLVNIYHSFLKHFHYGKAILSQHKDKHYFFFYLYRWEQENPMRLYWLNWLYRWVEGGHRGYTSSYTAVAFRSCPQHQILYHIAHLWVELLDFHKSYSAILQNRRKRSLQLF